MTFNPKASSPADGFYVRGNIDDPETVEDLATFCVGEFRRLQEALEQMRTFLYLTPQDELPVAAWDGQIGYFRAGVAGVDEGFYGYEAGTWNKL